MTANTLNYRYPRDSLQCLQHAALESYIGYHVKLNTHFLLRIFVRKLSTYWKTWWNVQKLALKVSKERLHLATIMKIWDAINWYLSKHVCYGNRHILIGRKTVSKVLSSVQNFLLLTLKVFRCSVSRLAVVVSVIRYPWSLKYDFCPCHVEKNGIVQ